MPEECAAMRLRLRIELCRLLDWGDVAGLLKVEEVPNGPAKTAEEIAEEEEALEHKIRKEVKVNRVVIVAVLTEIKTLLKQFAKANGDYTALQSDDDPKELGKKEAVSEIDLGDFKDVFESPEFAQEARKYQRGFNHIVRTYKGLSSVVKHPKRLKWVTLDRDKFKTLLSRLKELTDYLHQTMGDRQMEILQETSRQTYLALLQVSNSVNSIKSLLTATEWDKQSGSTVVDGHERLLESLTLFKLSTTELTHPQNQSIDQTEAALANHLDKQSARSVVSFKGSNIWIEWRLCKPRFLKPLAGPDDPLFEKTEPDPDSVTKVKELVRLLTLDKPTEFCIPHCLGYMVKPSHRQFGLIFEVPQGMTQNPRSLQTLLGKNTPAISRRIALAKKLVTCLLYLHSVNWLHKFLQSDNVLFFSSDLSNPYLSGFDFARPDRPDQTNSGPGTGQIPHWTFHCRPEYLGHSNQGLFQKNLRHLRFGNFVIGNCVLETRARNSRDPRRERDDRFEESAEAGARSEGSVVSG